MQMLMKNKKKQKTDTSIDIGKLFWNFMSKSTRGICGETKREKNKKISLHS